MAVGIIAAHRAERTTEGYFLASGKMPWWLIGAAFVSTSVSSEQIVGTVGATYKGGLAVANWEWWSLPTYTLVLLFFIPLYLRNRIMTVPELLNRRYGPACGVFYSCVILLGYVFIFLPPVLYGGGITFSELTGWPSWAVILGIASLTASYTLLGGLGSVMWTDAMQCLMLIGGGVVLFFVALERIPGGWPAMVAAAPERFHLYRPPADPRAPFLGLIIASFGVFLFYQSTNQVMIQRVLFGTKHAGWNDRHHLRGFYQSGPPTCHVLAGPNRLSIGSTYCIAIRRSCQTARTRHFPMRWRCSHPREFAGSSSQDSWRR